MELVVMKKNKPFTTSLLMSDGIGIEHRAVLDLIRKYKDRKIFKTFTVEPQRLKTKGREKEFYYLSESQAIFLITLMKNSDKVLDFKESLVNAFIKYRDTAASLLAKSKEPDYVIKRIESKTVRKELTDMIQKFIAYAKDQGSKSAEHYYSNFSRMQLTGLFLLDQKYPNAREVMSIKQLNLIEMADEAIALSLEDSMLQGLPYKECYKKAKDKIELLARIFPPSPLAILLAPDAKNELTNEAINPTKLPA
jgi:phage regulator Rha-like protein